MYLQTLGFLMIQLLSPSPKNQMTLSTQNLSNRDFCSDRTVLVICGKPELEIWLLN